MSAPLHPSDCGCSPGWRHPKTNGTCATCGGWLPGERYTLPWLKTAPGTKREQETEDTDA